MTIRSAPSNLESRDAVGILYLLLSGTGVVFLPTTAKRIHQSDSAIFRVAFARTLTLLPSPLAFDSVAAPR